MTITRTVLAAVVLSLIPMQAWAACAWVVWQQTTDLTIAYAPVEGTASERECGTKKGELERGPRPTTIDKDTDLRYICLPETIDPRVPKSVAR